jgi:hypothetical protein
VLANKKSANVHKYAGDVNRYLRQAASGNGTHGDEAVPGNA